MSARTKYALMAVLATSLCFLGGSLASHHLLWSLLAMLSGGYVTGWLGGEAARK